MIGKLNIKNFEKLKGMRYPKDIINFHSQFKFGVVVEDVIVKEEGYTIYIKCGVEVMQTLYVHINRIPSTFQRHPEKEANFYEVRINDLENKIKEKIWMNVDDLSTPNKFLKKLQVDIEQIMGKLPF